jgi:hypothetical protein
MTPMPNTIASAVLVLAALQGCTVVNTVQVPSDRQGNEVFVTAGDIPEPYESLGLIQVQRSGFRLFGFLDPVGTDLETGFKGVLIPQIQLMGGDGAINVRFHMTQLNPAHQALLAFPFFFVPWPTQVVITGEVVKLRR